MRNAAGQNSFTSARSAATTRACSSSLARTRASIPSAIFRNAPRLRPTLTNWIRKNSLPKTILYNVNPVDNYAFATMIGNFQDGTIPGKIQFGSGWWFLDQKEGMEMQMNALSNLGLLSRFIGMITDSRSFMRYPRHEYFRRTLCNLIGRDIENGEIPNDEKLVGPMIRNICFANAKEYMAFPGLK
jgi:glucuronate isomerase